MSQPELRIPTSAVNSVPSARRFAKPGRLILAAVLASVGLAAGAAAGPRT